MCDRYACDNTRNTHCVVPRSERNRLALRRHRLPQAGEGRAGARVHAEARQLPRVLRMQHGRGPCQNPTQSDMITSASNAAVQKIAAAVSEGDKARWTLLINAGVAFAANGSEDKTIPDWMLPGTFGNRAFPDKVDLALIIGWGRGSPPPTLAQKRRIKIVLVEVGYTHDHHLPERVNEKRSKYVALALALRAAGWNVILCDSAGDPDVWFKPSAPNEQVDREEGEILPAIHTVVIGHCGSHVRSNLAAFAALGIPDDKAKALLLDLSKLAIRQLKSCQSTYMRACKLVSAGVPAPSPAHSSATAAAAAAAAHAAGIG